METEYQSRFTTLAEELGDLSPRQFRSLYVRMAHEGLTMLAGLDRKAHDWSSDNAQLWKESGFAVAASAYNATLEKMEGIARQLGVTDRFDRVPTDNHHNFDRFLREYFA